MVTADKMRLAGKDTDFDWYDRGSLRTCTFVKPFLLSSLNLIAIIE